MGSQAGRAVAETMDMLIQGEAMGVGRPIQLFPPNSLYQNCPLEDATTIMMGLPT